MGDEYGRAAAFYDLLLNPIMDSQRRMITGLLAGQGAGSVLDICCGTGRQALFLHEAGMEVLGVDRSPAMLHQAREKTPESIIYLLEDATCLSLPDARVDSAVISMALHEMPSEARGLVLDEALRVARKHLLVVDYAPPRGFVSRGALLMAHIPERAAGQRHYAMFKDFLSRDGIFGLLKEKGLAPVESRPVFSGAARLVLCPLS